MSLIRQKYSNTNISYFCVAVFSQYVLKILKKLILNDGDMMVNDNHDLFVGLKPLLADKLHLCILSFIICRTPLLPLSSHHYFIGLIFPLKLYLVFTFCTFFLDSLLSLFKITNKFLFTNIYRSVCYKNKQFCTNF